MAPPRHKTRGPFIRHPVRGDFLAMAKPIKITHVGPIPADKAGRGKPGYTIHVNGKPVVRVKKSTLAISETTEGEAFIMTYKAAEHFAHQIGRYKLGLGDLIFTYVDGLKGT